MMRGGIEGRVCRLFALFGLLWQRKSNKEDYINELEI
jgi:hypothetical protein